MAFAQTQYRAATSTTATRVARKITTTYPCATMSPPIGRTNVRADLQKRISDVGDALGLGVLAVRDGWTRATNALASFNLNPEERAKSALRGWFAETGSADLDGFAGVTRAEEAPAASRASSVPVHAPLRSKRRGVSNTRTPKEELGTSTWVFLHTLAAQYPSKPSARQKRDVTNLINLLTRLYPCGECAEHFQEIVKVHPPQVGSREALSRWMCDVHNVVNRSLDKPVFNCAIVSSRWKGLDGDGSCGDETGCRLRTY